MGWFRRSGRHSYGVPVVSSPVAVSVSIAPPVVEPLRPAVPPRLPDDRTAQQIGGKVAEVLWGYYGQQAGTGTPLAAASDPGLAAQTYDDAYADALLAAPAPTIATPVPPPPPPPPLPVEPMAAEAAEPITAGLPSSSVSSIAPAVSRYQVFQRFRASAPVVAPVSEQQPAVVPAAPAKVAAAPVLRPYVVQLGFMDGSTMDLAGDDPAAKALRAAALVLTLREQSSR